VEVLLPIHDHVDEAVTHFSRRAKRSRVVAISEDTAPSTKGPIDGARQADRRPHQATRESDLVTGLDEKVHVIGLHRKVHDSKPGARRPAESLADLEKHHLSP
jgi:hypothetical protein